MLAAFITKFVLCSRCRLPEWSYYPLKSKRVGLKCRGCGQKSYVDELDIDAKFVKFVQNKPPPKSEHLDKNAAKGQEAVKQREKENAKMLKDAEKIKVGENEEVEFESDVSDAALAARAAEMVPEKLMTLVFGSGEAATNNDGDANNDDDNNNDDDDNADDANGGDEKDDDAAPDEDDGDADATAAAAAAPASSSSDNLAALLGGDVKKAVAAVEKAGATDAERLARLFDCAVPDVCEFGAAVKQHGALLKAVISKAPATRTALLLTHWQARVEALSEADRVPLKKRAPVTCKALYDADIVEEEHFLAWQKSGDTGSLGKLVAPFLNWLAEADEDDDEEE
jgi:translation initiation factor 5